ncbi:MAG TPA: M1 family metallopeptidase [Candidatus Acidoferrales bacterium]|nr:M1 family metallopeptidase [Candidatus Acidoferrales bacterium]
MRPPDFRLDPRVRPTRYGLDLDLDMGAWTFRGRERIELVCDEERAEIVLHARDLELLSVPDGSDASLDAAAGALVLRFARPLSAGTHALDLEFAGTIRPDLKALYRSIAGEERYAITTLWPAEARRLYPCFDEPPFKARFSLTLTVPSDATAIANTRVVGREDAGPGRTRWRFAETEPLSPYLLAFAVGPFEGTPEIRTRAGAPVRVWVPRGLAKDATFARDAQRDAIDWLETYTGIAYPYDKVEGVGVRDFPAGAMENPGAVTYRLELVTTDPATASARALKATVSVASHELTHMWWGDLATLAWWDDLWLSESFATFVGHKAEDAVHPEWSVWRDFVFGATRGFALDALTSTHAIRADAASAEAALQRVDAVTYQKGASVLRMLEAYLGEDAFREGVRRYLRRFAGGSATARDFWDALATASGQDVGRVAEAWITEPGHPIVTFTMSSGRVVARQQRYLRDRDAATSARRWPVPLVLRTRAGEERARLDGDEVMLRFRDALLFPNARATGFYRFAVDAAIRRAMVAGVAQLDPLERLLWVDNDWTLARDGVLPAADYLALLDALAGERDRAVLSCVAEHLAWISSHATTPASAPRLASIAERLFRPVLERLGWDARPGEDDDDRELRAVAVGVLGEVARADDVRGEAMRRVVGHLDGARQAGDLVGAIAHVAAPGGDVELQRRYAMRLRQPADPQDEQRFLGAIPAFADGAATKATFALIEDGTIRAQDLSTIYFVGMRNTAAREWYWQDLRARFERTIAPLEAMVRNSILSSLSQLTPATLAREADDFLASVDASDSAEVLARVRETLRLQSAAARRFAKAFETN